jgi:alpha-L-rhamnosidase
MPGCARPLPVRFEHRTDDGPILGIGEELPRLSWVIPSADPDFRQRAYEIELTLGSSVESFVVESDEQVLVPWPGTRLQSRERMEVRVRVRDDSWSPWSDPGSVEAGLLHAEDWSARFISPATRGRIGMPAPIVQGRIEIPDDVASARLYVTALGLHAITINGTRASGDVLAPGWTSYSNRLRYHVYDVTALLGKGTNVVEGLLGNGWYRGRLGSAGRRALYGDRLALLAQLEVTTVDGLVHTLATDETWTARDSGVLADDIYDGQSTDLRLTGDEVTRDPVEIIDRDLARLVAPDGPPVRVTETIPAQKVWAAPSGEILVDFGQNVVGWVRLKVRGLDVGQTITIRHAEVLEHDELGVRPLRTAQATDTFKLAGSGDEVLEPGLTFHGFRYAGISGCGPLNVHDIEAVVVGSNLRRTGWFSCSSELVNQLHENIVWGMRGNFLDVPTDCPQRDERLGWTGDIEVFAPTATFLFDCAGFLVSWLKDLAADQCSNGAVPYVIPDIFRDEKPTAAAWGDAATVVPWVIYQRTGDSEVLRRQFPSMKAWVDCITDLAGPDRIWSGALQFGDWLDPTAPPDYPFAAKVDPHLVATAYLIRSAEIVSDAAGILGDAATEERYRALASEVRAAFEAEYLTANGRMVSDAPTAYSLALCWALLPHELQRANAGARLADLIRVSGFRVSTGFVGTPLIADALTKAGYVDVAHRLLMQTGVPSWLYAVCMGATTVWERWDSMLPDGSINPGEMTSFNHYALGAVADWLYRSVAGLEASAPGYREIRVQPRLGGRLTSANAHHVTPYGEAAVSWSLDGGEFRLMVTVPVGATATVHLPDGSASVRVGHGSHSWDCRVVEPTSDAKPATVRALMDDSDRWDAVVAAGVQTGIVNGEPDMATRLTGHLDDPTSGLFEYVTRGSIRPGADEFRRLVEALA